MILNDLLKINLIARYSEKLHLCILVRQCL